MPSFSSFLPALLFTALLLSPTGAHLLELPNKIGLDGRAYLTVQQLYRGWALSGVVVFVAPASRQGGLLPTRPLHVRIAAGRA